VIGPRLAVSITVNIRILAAALLLITVSIANANIVELGSVNLTGNFTLNHNYDFNHPGAQPFGHFGPMTARDVTGVFLNWAHAGDHLGFRNSNALNTVSQLPIWTLGRVLFATTSVLIVGPDISRTCVGLFKVLTPGSVGAPPNSYMQWSFTAPGYDPEHDITGPIILNIVWLYDDGRVPDGGSTLLMLGIAAASVVVLRRGWEAQVESRRVVRLRSTRF
jgi:hypothetical protein